MSSRVLWLPALAALLLACGPASAAAPPGKAKVATASDAQALTAKIDQHIAARWDKVGAKPAPLADDAEFVRRIYLDLAGRIPSVAEARAFLNDRRADRRSRLVEQLLAGPRYAAHFTNVYRALLIPEAGNNFQVRLGQGQFEDWLKQRLAHNTGYDQMVRELLTTRVGNDPGFPFTSAGPSPLTFYLAKEFKPENLAAGTARAFLGVSVECAQCHNHPFADWKKEQFWSFAAFFAGIQSRRQQDVIFPTNEDVTKRELPIPGTDRVAKAKFLDGSRPEWRAGTSARVNLAEWLTSASNPYFARATVNRTWAYFFGTGLVEPVDEMVGGSSKPSHPELLHLLADDFAAHGFDLKYLIRAITASRAYQLTSATTHKSQDDLRLFARMPLRGLTGEQLFDSVAMATGHREAGGEENVFAALLGGRVSARSEFLTKFAPSERPTETQTSILQALTLMNGRVIADATSLEKSVTLAALADVPFATTAERVEALYLATLSRKPTDRESARAVRFVQDAVKRAKSKDGPARRAASSNALADVFWALLNSPEFALNH
jgi:hypothetical protein